MQDLNFKLVSGVHHNLVSAQFNFSLPFFFQLTEVNWSSLIYIKKKVLCTPGGNACKWLLLFETQQIGVESGTTFNSPSTQSKLVKWGRLMERLRYHDRLPLALERKRHLIVFSIKFCLVGKYLCYLWERFKLKLGYNPRGLCFVSQEQSSSRQHKGQYELGKRLGCNLR